MRFSLHVFQLSAKIAKARHEADPDATREDDDDGVRGPTPPPMNLTSMPMRASGSGTQHSQRDMTAPDPQDPLVEMSRQGEQLLASHQTVLQALSGGRGMHKDRTAFCDWINHSVQHLDTDLWRQFRREAFNYLEGLMQEQETRNQQQPQITMQPTQQQQGQVPQQQPRQQQQSQVFQQAPQDYQVYQDLQGTSSGMVRQTQDQFGIWQPNPNQWPRAVSGTSVWGSMDPGWMAKNVPGFGTSPCTQSQDGQLMPSSSV